MTPLAVAQMNGRVSLNEIEEYHRSKATLLTTPVSLQEIIVTLLLSVLLTPFFFVLFFVLPMIGQIVVTFALCLTAVYLRLRRSWIIAAVVALGSVSVAVTTFLTIQGIKTRLDVALFVLLAFGIPVTAIYCIYLSMKIWWIRNGTNEN